MLVNEIRLTQMVSLLTALLSNLGCERDENADSTSAGPTVSAVTTSQSSSTGATPTTGQNAGETNDLQTTDDAKTSGSEVEASGTSTSETGSTGYIPCSQGEIVCDDNTAKMCDGIGGYSSEEACLNACTPGIGCILCIPGYQCVAGTSQKCANDGQRWEDEIEVCDPVQGVSCDENTGRCVGDCSKGILGNSYIGCDYYPTVLTQENKENLQYVFGVAVSNIGEKQANLLMEQGQDLIVQTVVPPHEVKIIELPWVDELATGAGPSVVVEDGAYRLRSDQPVTVYQYNPLGAVTSNDASLLLPVNTWTKEYLVASWPTWKKEPFVLPGFYAVVASQDDTQIVLKPSQNGGLVQAGGGVAADGSGMLFLHQGDVLQVLTELDGKSDVTGAFVHADKPVQVFGGHRCTQVPLGVEACDHLEESMFPVEALGQEYIVVPPVQMPDDSDHKAQVVRVIAVEDSTALTFEPDQPVQKFLGKAGDFMQVPSGTAFYRILADKRIMVVQFMVGQAGGYGTGDPSMLLAVSPVQWRSDYLVHAPVSWQGNYADLITKEGAEIMVDDSIVVSWQPIGATGYVYSHAKLTNAENGNHKITGNRPVGVSVCGLQNSGSYWYPGGLNLNLIPQ